MISINPQCNLNDDELSFTFIRSGGPGGQNVNKVSTAVRLRFNVLSSQSIDPEIKHRLLKLAGSRATLEGEIIIHADTHRTQDKNRAEAIQRLVELIQRALQKPKKRTKTKPTYSSGLRRMETKKKRGDIKKGRKYKMRGNED